MLRNIWLTEQIQKRKGFFPQHSFPQFSPKCWISLVQLFSVRLLITLFNIPDLSDLFFNCILSLSLLSLLSRSLQSLLQLHPLSLAPGATSWLSNSPVEQVRLTVFTTDDPSLPVWTFRIGGNGRGKEGAQVR